MKSRALASASICIFGFTAMAACRPSRSRPPVAAVIAVILFLALPPVLAVVLRTALSYATLSFGTIPAALSSSSSLAPPGRVTCRACSGGSDIAPSDCGVIGTSGRIPGKIPGRMAGSTSRLPPSPPLPSSVPGAGHSWNGRLRNWLASATPRST